MTLPIGALAIADALAKSFEGCVLHPYLDSARPRRWTIGWGNRELLDGTPVTASTKLITQAMADQIFDRAMSLIEPKLALMVQVTLAAYEAGALLSMQYNIGSGAMAGSNVIRQLNAGNRLAAAGDMLDWDHTGTVVSDGLLRRRRAERAVFLGLLNPLNQPAPEVPQPTMREMTTDKLNAASAAGTLNLTGA